MDRYELKDWLTRGRITLLIVLGVLLLVGAVGALPAWRGIKTWRAQRFAAEGEVLVAKGQWESAGRKAAQAMQLAAGDLRVQRLMARVLTRFGQERAVTHWVALLKHPRSTPLDREEAIAASLRARAWDTAREQLLVAMGKPPVSAQVYQLASDYYTAQGDFKQGVNFARQALQAAPADGTNILFTAQRLLLTQGASEIAEARALLDAHAAVAELTGVEALVLLAMRFTNSPAAVDDLTARLRKHPARTLQHEFLAFDLEWKNHPDKWSELVTTACQRHAGADNDALLQLGRWLNRHSQYSRVLDHLPLRRALQSQELYLVHLDALAGLRRWADVEAALDTTSAPIQPFYQGIYKVRAQMEQGRQDVAVVNWSILHTRAANNLGELVFLAQYAEKTGALTEALRAYRRVVELDTGNRPALNALLALTSRQGTTRDVRDVLALVVVRFPEDTAAQNDHAFFNLLLNENVDPSRQTAELLHKAQPDLLAYRMTLALAYLRLNRAAEGAALIAPLKVDWNKVNASWRTVLAATLQAKGDSAAAAKIAANLSLDGLRPEEKALLKKN